jgi:hypothetical protein
LAEITRTAMGMEIPIHFYSRIFALPSFFSPQRLLHSHFSHHDTSAEQARVGHSLQTSVATTRRLPSPCLHRPHLTRDPTHQDPRTSVSPTRTPGCRTPVSPTRTLGRRSHLRQLLQVRVAPIHSYLLMSTVHCYVCTQLDWYVFAI